MVSSLSEVRAVAVGQAASSDPGGEARRLARALQMTTTVAEWLLRRGHGDSEATRRYLDPKLAHLTAPDGMVDRALAADRLASAVRRRERIAVFGDYDCDGITSTAIVTEILRALGGDVVPLLASRFEGGYGLSAAATERVLATGATVVVTCDCGSSDHAQLARLRERGVDAVVIDHHLVPEEPLPAVAFLNPHRPECGFPYKGLASCGLALNLGAAVRAVLGEKLDLRRWLDLVAIGTIADVAPLDGDNRALVRAGLAALGANPRPGLAALAELAKLGGLGAPPGARDVAFRIAPRLNAPGRLGSPDLALQLLLASSLDVARGLAASIEAISDQRRALQEAMTAEAIEEIEREGYRDRAAIVVGREGWGSGIVGIVAGRLAERFGKPVVVVGFEGDHGRGSVRGPKGVRLHDALVRIQGCLERFGGHQAAAGLEVRKEKLPELREAFERAIEGQDPVSAADPMDEAVRLAAEDHPARVVEDLERLEPCGHGNPAPRLVVEGRVVEAREVRGGHLKLDLLVGDGHRLGGFGLNMGERATALSGPVAVLGELRRDTYRGGGAVEVLVERVLG
jgi:single-stranded-DNA-specific exonuclease